jgi:sigma-B regulation protein RsbU (phosphoserine phosphatase)
VITFILFLIINLCYSWFIYGGSSGEAKLFFIPTVFVILFLLKDYKKIVFTACTLIVLITLLLVEYFYPELVITMYTDRLEIFIDVGIGVILLIIFIYLFLTMAVKEINRQRKKVEHFNKQLIKELKYAKRIQDGLIPESNPQIEDIKFHSIYLPMIEVGGDLYDFIKIREPHLVGIFISDVSGHGVPAALTTSLVKALLHTVGSEKLNPSKLLQYINVNVYKMTKKSGNFLTAFYGVYDSNNKKMIFSRGGHNYPFLIRDKTVSFLRGRGLVLGIYDAIKFDENEVQLYPNDKLIFYTDGLTEATNELNQQFEDILLSKILIQHADKPIKEYVLSIYSDLQKFTNRTSFNDDVCIVGMEVL